MDRMDPFAAYADSPAAQKEARVDRLNVQTAAFRLTFMRTMRR
jgi:hypothetical protein